MENAAPRFNISIIIAACIVGVALIASAVIVVHRPAASRENIVSLSMPTAKPVVMPPITQASAQEQFRAQVLAASTLHSFLYNGKAHTLADVKVTKVTYVAKDDVFTIDYDWVWQPTMPSDGPQSDSSQFINDGYGHYYGAAVLSPIVGGSGQNADIILK